MMETEPPRAEALATAAPLRVGARVAGTSAEGPGRRYALWLQGCSIRCPGCCNPQLFDPAGGEVLPVAAVLEEIASLRGEIEGVTVLGGEPFDQADGLLALARGVRAVGLSFVVFSGFTLEELQARGDAAGAALGAIDVLVDGRYEASRPEAERLWVGSTNQLFHYLTGRYNPLIERPGVGQALRTVEVRLALDGRLSANGWPALDRGSLRAIGPAVSSPTTSGGELVPSQNSELGDHGGPRPSTDAERERPASAHCRSAAAAPRR